MGSAREGGVPGTQQVGRWRFDRSLNTLACGDEIVRVEPKVADLLQAFLERPGEVLSRANLLDTVWPGVVVGDEALSQSINKLRRALGDTSREAAYLQTVPKRGYRLIAGVARSSDGPQGIEADRTEPDAEARARARDAEPFGSRRRFARRGVPVLLLAAALGLGWLAVRDGDDLAAIVERAALPVDAREAIPEVLVRRFHVIGPDARGATMARAFQMQVVAAIAQSSRVRVIASEAEPAGRGQSSVSPWRYQVDGTLQEAGERLVIHLTLSNTASGIVLWSRRFDLLLDGLASENQAAGAELLQALAIKLTESERNRLARPFTRSERAFQHFLAGQAAFSTRDPQRNLQAREHYHRALVEDPAFGRALAGIALTFAADATFGRGDRREAIRLAMDSASRALESDPELPDVHWVLAWVELQGRRHAQALRHARRAVDLNPSYADAYALAATIASYTGHSVDALTLMRTAFRLSPSPGFLYHLVLGRASFFLGHDEQAIAHLGVSLRKNPAFLESRVYLAAALARRGRAEEAAWEAEEIRSMEPAFALRAWLEESLLTDREEIAALAGALSHLGLDSLSVAGARSAGHR